MRPPPLRFLKLPNCTYGNLDLFASRLEIAYHRKRTNGPEHELSHFARRVGKSSLALEFPYLAHRNRRSLCWYTIGRQRDICYELNRGSRRDRHRESLYFVCHKEGGLRAFRQQMAQFRSAHDLAALAIGAHSFNSDSRIKTPSRRYLACPIHGPTLCSLFGRHYNPRSLIRTLTGNIQTEKLASNATDSPSLGASGGPYHHRLQLFARGYPAHLWIVSRACHRYTACCLVSIQAC